MTLSGYFMLKSVFGQQGCRTLTLALARLSCYSESHEDNCYCRFWVCWLLTFFSLFSLLIRLQDQRQRWTMPQTAPALVEAQTCRRQWHTEGVW